MGRQVVVWSGGADSTCLLQYYAKYSSKEKPVTAITIDGYPQISKGQLECQRFAQKRYLRFAKKEGLFIEHLKIKVEASSECAIESGKNRSVQPVMWLSAIMPFVNDGDTVCFSYIHKDGIWKSKAEFEKAFYSLCKLKGVDAKLEFSLDEWRKYQVLNYLKEEGITHNMWWACERPIRKKPCGVCYKCCEIKMAGIEFEMEKKNPSSPFFEGENAKNKTR